MRDTSPGAGAPLGLYLHIPFCAALCGYCTFNRRLAAPDLIRRYVAALEREIRGSGADAPGGRSAADTLYFGGGTPSLLEPDDLARLVGACRDVFDVPADAEVTLEANPETVDARRLAGFRRAGANRLSLGVQSFRDRELARLGRIHTVARARAAVADARDAGFDNVSVDLMMWLPEQTLEDWLVSVDALAGLEPEHASLYMLELYPNAPLREDMAREGLTQAPDETAAEMYLQGMERLEAAGYRQYEISNLARPGRQSRHNLKYWTDGAWRGFGSGAHSTRDGFRWKNVPDTEEYIRRCGAGVGPAVDREVLTDRRRVEDALVMGLRLSVGVDLASIERRYGVDVWQTSGESLAPFVEAGLLVGDPGRLRLT
ncbi:MAG: radical SAM family heme chaperone HemW, partial [Acidobacteria bacterium]|nr:radical SAM family heme chaperone HemW [Acidobacteriota bacterium]